MAPTFLNRLICLMMAAVLLISSTGFVLVEHLCQMRGRSVSFWEGANTCKMHCPAPDVPGDAADHSRTTLEKAPCCQESTHLSRVETPSAKIAQLAIPVAPVLDLLYPAPVFQLSKSHFFFIERSARWLKEYHRLYGLPPARYLALVCVWQV